MLSLNCRAVYRRQATCPIGDTSAGALKDSVRNKVQYYSKACNWLGSGAGKARPATATCSAMLLTGHGTLAREALQIVFAGSVNRGGLL